MGGSGLQEMFNSIEFWCQRLILIYEWQSQQPKPWNVHEEMAGTSLTITLAELNKLFQFFSSLDWRSAN
jgi:hypothetical protein